MDQLLSLAPYAIGLVAIYFGWNILAPRLRIPRLTADDLATRLLGDKYTLGKVERAAAREIRAGNYLMAGKIYEDANLLAPAVDTYLKGDELMAAGFVLEKMPGRAEKAAECFLKAGDYKKAAEVYASSGRPGKAAPLYEEKGNNLEAARLYALAQQWERAAGLFLKGGYALRAAEAFEKNGDLLKAAQAYEKHFMENVTFATTYSSAPPASELRTAQRAGRLYEQAGEPEKAREIYLRGSFFKEAAAVCAGLGQFAKAAEYFLRADDLPAAADAFERAGDAVKAANYRGEVEFKAGRLAEAAALFQKAQDYQRAAEIFEQVGLLHEAAAAYEAGHSHAAAGHVYVRAGLKERAAACFERAGEHETAAQLYAEAGRAAPEAPPAGLGPAAPGTDAGAGPAGRRTPRFQIGETIGRGPLGTVHKGQDSAGRPVAVRLLPPGAEPHLPVLLQDLKAAAALAHPNLVRLLGLVEIEGRRAVVSELVQGTTLAASLRAGRRMAPAQALALARVLAQVLAAIHDRGLCHGSLQPSNVMSAAGAIKLADLGLGRVHAALVPASPYRAPEGGPSRAGDVFGFGALLHDVLVGTPRGPAPEAPVPAPFDKWLARCFDPRPEARPGADELVARLGAAS